MQTAALITMKKKIRNKHCTCKYCGQEFLAADVKAAVCPSCKESPALLGTCEYCGGPCKKVNRFCSKSCSTSYIHKTEPYRVGAQKGEANPAKRADVRSKIKEGVTRSYTNPDLLELRAQAMAALGRYGEFRSKQEEAFDTFLKCLGVKYEREEPQVLAYVKKGSLVTRYKIVDFVIPSHKIFIELTGFIWGEGGNSCKAQREGFREKLLELASGNPSNTYIISSDNPGVLKTVSQYFQGYHP